MFMVYDKDAGTFVDLREIMDFTEDDFQDNKEVAGILKQMNESNPV
jgi:Ca2+-binding EF-hand superfamily protein